MTYPDIDPVLVHLGPLQIRWYGMMYVLGFFAAYLILKRVCKREEYDMTETDIEDVLTWSILGLIVGARVGYCIFYNFGVYLSNPLKILAVWEGGMSFHGGLIGIIIAGICFSARRNKSFWMLADLGALSAPLGLFFGRMGNFINGELYGRVTHVSWGMVFPGAGPLPRHPSQLYEAFFEGLLMFVVIYALGTKKHTHGHLIAAFLVFYGGIRFVLEFFRQPDPQLGFVFAWLTMGQVLCALMVVSGVCIFIYRLKSDKN
ncbi:MAG: prolipoprotein diacylglyceryl transferase [Thermodesulfobacteriota bacterium]|nr:prolipoprotein diacylglyceryl transferase [Thermodesulfobacteriota bacterium]